MTKVSSSVSFSDNFCLLKEKDLSSGDTVHLNARRVMDMSLSSHD